MREGKTVRKKWIRGEGQMEKGMEDRKSKKGTYEKTSDLLFTKTKHKKKHLVSASSR